MRISEFLQHNADMAEFRTADGKTLQQTILEITSVWSNAACTGYCLKAAQKAGLSDTDVSAVLLALNECFDEMTVEEAETFFIID